MTASRFSILAAMVAGTCLLPLACSDSGITGAATDPLNSANSGTVVVQLTDAPFLTDSVKSVDIFVLRVDARQNDADSATADHGLSDDSSATAGWKSVATPNASYNLLSLQNGIAATLGQAKLAAGTYNGFRLVIDPTKSSVTLKGGQVLTSTSSPSVKFPSASRSGIKIELAKPVTVGAGGVTSLLVDFNVENSFVMRGNSIQKNGLLFKPVIHATVTSATTTASNANVRLINATGSALNLLQNGTALTGGSNLAFGTGSSCSSVSATAPALSVTQAGTSTPLTGFAPALTAGGSFSIVAYPNATGVVQFATLANAFSPAAGQTGLRVFNSTSGQTYSVFVTTPAAALGTPTVASVAAGASSAFVSVPAGASQIRIATGGTTTVVLDLGSQTLTAGQNMTLVIAAPAAGSTVPRAFLVAGC